MRTDTGQVFRLEDYRPSDYSIPSTNLVFKLAPDRTIVTSDLTIQRRAGVDKDAPLILDGDGLVLLSVAIDGRPLQAPDYLATPERLLISNLPSAESFRLVVETEIAPSRNQALMGLYRSSRVYCT
ncbi:MAG: aminopeptidase N, partial [Pseudaminobacter sp.]|nr:aminopeptidase N [Pseudaminobacter sp.]